MPRHYQRSDVKKPENKWVFGGGPLPLDSKLLDFQRLAYTAQLGEHSLGYRSGELKLWVNSISEYSKQRSTMETFFSSLLDKDITIKFESNPSSVDHTQTSFDTPNYNFITMFSGGLDSASFTSQCLREKHPGILHHTITHDNPYGKAKELFRKHFQSSGKFRLLSTRGENKIDNPMYLRTRGLIFLTNIQCLAAQLKTKKIVVPENGPFMINLRVSPRAEPTRTTNPQMLKDWTDVFNKITNSKLQIIMPYVENTKSEVIIKGGRSDLINDTWSCSYFQGLSKMCGMCNSCLVRILSCYAINEGEDIVNVYKDNPFTIPYAKLRTSKLNSYRISLDAVEFWLNIIHPDKIKNELDKMKFRSINRMYPVMYRHALDMFLGFIKLRKQYSSKEPLFLRFEKQLKNIDSNQLKNRAQELLMQKKLVKWV